MRKRFVLMSFVVAGCFPATAQAASQVEADFNGDGLADFAVGVPEENLAGAGNGGAVNVIYGRAVEIRGAGSQLWSQDTPGIEDAPEAGDRFGHSVAGGDFNGDGFDDMAVGVRGEDVGTVADAGAVNVIYGSAAGLTATGNQVWTQDTLDVEDVAETSDWFGNSVSAGESGNGPGEELAIGAPMEDVGSATDGGAVNVLFGSGAGLTAAGDQLWHQSVDGVEDTTQSPEQFGMTVLWADFSGDGADDLAVSVPREFVGSIRAGGASVLYGSATGLTSTGDQVWDQNSPDIEGGAEGGDMLHGALAAGDFDADGHYDLALGYDGENVGEISHTGSANVIYGTPSGLNAADDQRWDQEQPGIEDNSEGGDNLAWALTAGDFDADGDDDLALGARREDLGSIVNAGLVHAIPGSPAGLTATGSVLISQDSPEVADDAETDDEFGSAFVTGDMNGDGRDELGIGSILEDINGIADAGATNLFYDAFSVGGANQLWHQDSLGVIDRVEDGDRLGYSFPG